jgi:RNA polymerase sigma factor (sigma-70 family)
VLAGRGWGASLISTTASYREQLWSAVLAERGRAERVAYARCSSVHDAEDCVQEAMARVVAMPDVDVDRVGPLLATVVTNLAMDTHRARARAGRVEARLGARPGLVHSPEDDVCDVEEARWLWRRRVDLGAQDRAVLELRAAGYGAADAAAALDVSYKTASSAYTRARTQMRAIWRAAAALLGVLWWRPVRPRADATAVALAASAAVVLVLLPGTTQGADATTPPPRVEPAQAATRSVSSDLPRRDGGSVAEQPEARDEPVVPRRVDERGRSGPRPTAHAPSVSAAGAETGETRLVREHDEESFTETLQRCIDAGVLVSPTHIECRDRHGNGTQ